MPRVHVNMPSLVAAPDAPDGLPAGWSGPLVPEGVPTGDGRLIEPQALRWPDLPLPLRDAPTDEGAHQGAVVVGQITELWRDGPMLWGRGLFDLASDAGREAARKVRDGMKNGVSVDLDDVDIEVRVAAEAADGMYGDPVFSDDDREPDEDGRIVIMEIASDDEMLVTVDARVRAATIVDIPAFVEARIDPDSTVNVEELVASAQPARPPAAWFADPRLAGPTPLTVGDDGRVFGHLACWDACHTGFDECVSPPRSASGYAYFRVGAVLTDDGVEVPTGRITVDTTHAGRRAGPVDTLAHYERTGMAVADVSAGEDEWGVWVAGALRPGVTDEQVAALRASPLSGDWRRVGGSLELVAALAVNTPGFPIPRALVASGTVQALTSAGSMARRRDAGLSPDDVRVLREVAGRERADRTARQAKAEASRRRLVAAASASRIRHR